MFVISGGQAIGIGFGVTIMILVFIVAGVAAYIFIK